MEVGTLQYNIEADTTDIDRASSAVDKMADDMNKAGAASDNLAKKITGVSAAAGSSAKATATSFDKITQSLERQVALYGNTSAAASARYEAENGLLSELTQAQKKHVISLAETVDQMDRAAEASAKKAMADQQSIQSAKITQAALEQQFNAVESGLLREISLYGDVSRSAKLAFEIESGALKNLSALQKQNLVNMSSQLDALEKSAGGAGGGLSKIRNIAQSAGYQLQDVAVQAQMGTSAFTILGQQGSQFASAFGPTGAVVGAILAVSAAILGSMLPSLFKAGEAAKDVSELTKELTKDFKDFTEAQKAVINTGVVLSLSQEKKALEEKKQAIDDVTISLAHQKIQYEKAYNSNAPSFEASNSALDKKAQLVKLGLEQIKIEQNIKDLEDPSGSAKKLKSIGDEISLIGLKGEALLREKGAQDGLTGSILEQYVQLGLSKDKKIEDAKLSEKAADDAKKAEKQITDSIKNLKDQTSAYGLTGKALAEYTADKMKATGADREAIISLVILSEKQKEQLKNSQDMAAASKKSDEDKKRLAESTQKLISSMQREADLYGVTSRYLQTEYDLKAGLIVVTGGLNSVKAQELLIAAKRIDQMAEERDLAEQLDAEGDRDRKKIEENTKKAAKFSEDAAERINGAFANAWVGLLDGSTSVFDGIKKAFFQTIAEMAHEAITKPIILNIQQSLTGGGSSIAQGAGIGKAGLYAAAAAVTVSLVSLWNKKQDEKFIKLTAEYKQSNQGLSAVLGEGNKQNLTISKSIEKLGSVNGNVLDVNYQMLFTLQDIRTGIGQAAAGFAKNIANGAPAPATGTSTINSLAGAAVIGGYIGVGIKVIGDAIGGDIGNFINGVIDKVSSALYSKKKKLIDSGIQVYASSLEDIINGATIQAESYADISTTKKVIGIKTSTKVKRTSDDLGEVFEQQFTDIFSNAGEALKQASAVFGVNFDAFSNQLLIDAQDISLKDLKGDELTKAIENFFSSTMDEWAGVLLSGTNVLLDFQAVGESAFDTMIRLASETNTFSDYANRLGLNIHAVGMDAVYATQAIAEASGGFDALSSSLATYYDKFFSVEDKLADATKSINTYFSALGVAVPRTREEFKALVSSIDLTTEAGAKQFAALIKVSGAMDQYITGLDSQAEELAKQAEEIKKQKSVLAENSYSALGRAVNAQKKIIDGQIEAMNKALSTSRSVYSALTSALDGMVISSTRTQEATRKQAQAQLSGMLASAKGGVLPNVDDLNRALSVISQPSENLYGTFQEYAADFYATADTIKQLQDIAGAQVTTEELALAELERQSTSLDDLLEWGKMQLDVLNGIDISISTVADALRSFASVTGSTLPTEKNKRFIDMSAQGETGIKTPQQQAAMDAAQIQAASTDKQNKDFQEFMKASQISIADSTDKIKKLIEKFDTIGMPPERAV